MKEFLISLCLGTNEIPKKYSSIYEQIKSCGAIENHQSKKHHNFFKLHCKFGIFSVSKPKSSLAKSIFLQDITKRQNDIRLSLKNTPKSLENGEIVLALLAGRFVRVIKSLSSHSTKHTQKQNLIYLEKQKGKIIGINFQDGEISTLPFSQKSLEQLPYHCVFSYENIKPKINKIYGVLEESKVDEAIALFLGDRKEEFSQEAKQLAKSFGDRVEPSADLGGGLYGGRAKGRVGSKVSGRVDLSKLDFITIDPSDAKDHDDAIYYDEKSKVLYVAIADVSEYVQPKTALDEEAKQRLFSLYFPHKCHPMLPQELSENLCSLKANELKLALVCEIHFCATSSRKITPKSTKIYEALITPKANVSYEYIDSLLDTLESAKKSIFKPLKSLANPRWILSFWHIARELKNERLKKGFDFFTKERKMILDKEGEIESIHTILPTRAHSLIEEAMLLANVSVAMALDSALGGKGIYRTHNPPTKDRLHALFLEIAQLGYTIEKSRAKKPQNDYSKNIHSQIAYLQSLANTQKEREIIDKLIIKSQKEARYDCSKNEHFGLGFEAYTHFTSPIRRYSDILAHRLIKLLLRSSGTLDISFAKNLSSLPNKKNKEIARHINFTLETIRIATPLLNDAERAIAKCEMCFKDRKYARSAQKWQGESIHIRIIDERFPAIGVVDFAESSEEANDKSSKAKSSKAKSGEIKSPTLPTQATQSTQLARAAQQLAVHRTPNAALQEILQGARIFVRDSSLQKHATYLAQIAQVELGSARIYANILDISTQVDSTPRAKSTKKPKNKHKTTKKQSSQKHKKQTKSKSKSNKKQIMYNTRQII